MVVESRPSRSRRAWTLFGLVSAIFLAGLVGYVLNWVPGHGADWGVVIPATDVLFRLGIFLFPLMGTLILSRQGRNAVGSILVAIGFVWFLGWFGQEYARYTLVTNPGALPRPDVALALSTWTWIPAMGMIGTFLLLLFPNGRLPSPKWKGLAWVSGIALTLASGVQILASSDFRDFGYGHVGNPLSVASLRPLLQALEPSIMLVPLCVLAGFAALVVRFRRSSGVERLQLKWLAAGAGAAATLYLLAMAASFPFWASGGSIPSWLAVLQEVALISFALIPLAVGLAILRYRLYDIDLVINRSVVYAILTLLILGTYVAVVFVFERALTRRISFGPSLLATAVVAVGFAPARDRVQRVVDRLLYGDRRNPYRAISALATRLAGSLALDEVMPVVVENVASALRFPWAEVRVHGGAKPTVWTYGRKEEPEEEVFPLRYRGEPVGELAVGLRRGERELDPSDRRLLDDLAVQAGAAAHAVSLTQALQQSRQRLVTTREEERRRLRRDLHDGLGPELTAVAMKIDLARRTLAVDAEDADRMLEELRARVKSAIDDIRRLVYDLRPPALDELGLIGALRQQAEHFTGNGHGLSVSIQAPEDLPALSAATEVAAFRIVAEAITNAARHGGARSCDVHLGLDNGLRIEVTDDGRWKQSLSGVGINSMRERAQELGGTCEAGPTEDGRARVVARLPLEPA